MSTPAFCPASSSPAINPLNPFNHSWAVIFFFPQTNSATRLFGEKNKERKRVNEIAYFNHCEITQTKGKRKEKDQIRSECYKFERTNKTKMRVPIKITPSFFFSSKRIDLLLERRGQAKIEREKEREK
ncbi:MAG: hypothetical protein Q8P67_01370, partial [archaeon]|nr:hypothetical protein [archaeon]